MLLLTVGCSGPEAQHFARSAAQSDGAREIRLFLEDLDTLLERYRQKLNKRNPNAYNPETAPVIQEEILGQSDTIRFHLADGRILTSSYDYLQAAFEREKPRPYRNDLLIIGIHKLIWEAYDRGAPHTWTAFEYDLEKLKKAHSLLQIVHWKIKTEKDREGNYLFLTWQLNWQVELEKRLRQGEISSREVMQELQHIRDLKETFLDCSNTSFSEIIETMIYILGKTISVRGGEPATLGADMLTKAILFPIL